MVTLTICLETVGKQNECWADEGDKHVLRRAQNIMEPVSQYPKLLRAEFAQVQ